MVKDFHLGDEFDVKDREEFKLALSVFNSGKPEAERLYYFTYWNAIKNRRIIRICDKEFFYKWRNMVRNECRRKDTELRCVVPSQRTKGLVKCRADCAHCPFDFDMREQQFVSLEGLEAKGDSVAHTTYSIEDEVIERIVQEDRKKALGRELALLDETDRTILTLFNEGYSDPQIAAQLGRDRYFVLRRRNALIEKLKIKLKNY